MSDSDSPYYPRHLTNPGPLVGLPAEPAEVGGPDAADLEVAALRAEVAKQHARADDWRARCHAANKRAEAMRELMGRMPAPPPPLVEDEETMEVSVGLLREANAAFQAGWASAPADWVGPCEHGRDPWTRCEPCVERGAEASLRAAHEATLAGLDTVVAENQALQADRDRWRESSLAWAEECAAKDVALEVSRRLLLDEQCRRKDDRLNHEKAAAALMEERREARREAIAERGNLRAARVDLAVAQDGLLRAQAQIADVRSILAAGCRVCVDTMGMLRAAAKP